jgi:hypothetical protein
MFTRIFGLFALAFLLSGTQCWAQACNVEEANCHTFSPTSTSFTYQFFGDGQLTVQFDVVLTMFDLRVSIHTPKPTDSRITCEGPCPNAIPLDPNEFPTGTICVSYGSSTPGQCDQYDFTGNAGGPHGVPVRNTDYKGLITLTLTYLTGQQANIPAFGHAPGDITTFTENILTGYSTDPVEDPTMTGKGPGLSSVVALDEPLIENDTICNLTLNPPSPYTVGQEIEVSFQLFSTPCSGTPLRDKTAHFSLSTRDLNGHVIFPTIRDKEEGNKFHWDRDEGVNELDLSTAGLPPGHYTLTVFSSKASPRSVTFDLAAAP